MHAANRSGPTSGLPMVLVVNVRQPSLTDSASRYCTRNERSGLPAEATITPKVRDRLPRSNCAAWLGW